MFDELKEVKYFKETTHIKRLIMLNNLKNKTFDKSSKSRGVFRTQRSIYDGAFFVNILNDLLFLQ